MTRGTWVYRDGELIEKHLARPLRGPASELAAPMLIRDGMEPLRSMGDGHLYDSKSALRASYREQGLVEVGNDAPLTTRDNSRRITKAEIAEAIQKVRQGYRPAPLEHGVLPPEAQE